MELLRVDREAKVADMSLPQSCPACGGDLVLRAGPHGTWSHCRGCLRLSRSKLQFTPMGLQLTQPVGAVA